MKPIFSSFLFISFLLIIPSLSFHLKQIPVSVDKDQFTISDEFRSKYQEFAIVGELLKSRLISSLSSIINSNFPDNGFCLVPPVKQPASLRRKMDLEFQAKKQNSYVYKDFEDVKDFVRSSVIFSSMDEIYQASEYMEAIFGEVLKKDDTFNKDRSPFGKGRTGYRDLSYNFAIQEPKYAIKPNKTLANKEDFYYLRFEVQVHICGIFLAKQIGHLIYELTRVIGQISDKNDFNKIVDENHREEFYDLFYKIKEILPESKDSENLIETFEEWKADKQDKGLIKDFLDKMKEFSNKIYNSAMESDQSECINALKEAIINDSCEFKKGVDLEEISKDFVQKLLQKYY